ncbi:YchJ family protein [Sulfidibacter corallicola]|uniref:YchJ family protein n=1 Tax=Sulfidibacter corallicola TaxID=2818388 RepID=A0A8A4U0L5_SULCO|nr:YchJ family protein [Sulfidibacter corallicola]QTD52285.1 YchJ family protein [Sulfidibacter corallicola]
MDLCPCGSQKTFATCCGPQLAGNETAKTAEALMRARYTGYTRADAEFIVATTHPDKRAEVDPESVREWGELAEWLSLQIQKVEAGTETDTEGFVTFVARFRENGEEHEHHERSLFRKEGDTWYFVEGHKPAVVRKVVKTRRNDPCPCGSGQKYKKCCGKAGS